MSTRQRARSCWIEIFRPQLALDAPDLWILTPSRVEVTLEEGLVQAWDQEGFEIGLFEAERRRALQAFEASS